MEVFYVKTGSCHGPTPKYKLNIGKIKIYGRFTKEHQKAKEIIKKLRDGCYDEEALPFKGNTYIPKKGKSYQVYDAIPKYVANKYSELPNRMNDKTHKFERIRE